MKYFTPYEYIQIELANQFGLEKQDWQDRLDWFEQNQFNLNELIDLAESPAQFMAAIDAYNCAKANMATGGTVALDATSSGIQMFAVLTGDLEAAKLVNLVDTGNRENAYTTLYQRFKAKSGESADVPAESVKKAIMTCFYGSEAVPKSLFGEGENLKHFVDVLKESAPYCWELNEACLVLWPQNKDSYGWTMPDGFTVNIPVMSLCTDVFEFKGTTYPVYYYKQKPIAKGRAIAANIAHATDSFVAREITAMASVTQTDLIKLTLATNSYKGKYDPIKQNLYAVYDESNHPEFFTKGMKLVQLAEETGILSARIFKYMSNQLYSRMSDPCKEMYTYLINSLPTEPFEILTVHDCFRVHFNYGNDLRKLYANTLARISKSTLLNHIIKGVSDHDYKLVPKHDLSEYILKSDYAIC